MIIAAVALASVLLGVGEPTAQEGGVRVARLNPSAMPDAGTVAVPHLLSAADATQYRMILALQDKGRIEQADRLLRHVHDRLLVGHVLAHRYLHPTAYRSEFTELKRWLDKYADLPQARQIHALAQKRRPNNAPALRALADPVAALWAEPPARSGPGRHTGTRKRSAVEEASVKAWRQEIDQLVSNDQPSKALRRLGDARLRRLVDEVEHAMARGHVARGFLVNRLDRQAFEHAAAAAAAAGQVEPGAHWTAGIAAWRLGRYALAAQHFTSLANSAGAAGEDVAAGAFWAARAYMIARKPQLVQRFLKIAAGASDEFYGLLARAMAGQDLGFDWQRPLGRQGMDPVLLMLQPARRAIALAQIGETRLAEAELQLLAALAPRAEIASAIEALAEALQLPAAQLGAAQLVRVADGRRHASSLFPVPSWQPRGGFTLDRALVYALVRAESRFDPEAVSPAGAVGLMQIMPDTGAAIAKSAGVNYRGAASLKHPETNLQLGQAWIQKLRRSKLVGDSLIHLCLAYNGGLARLERWMTDLEAYDDDPLLFLESIPVAESRTYTKKVLANLWTYRERLGEPMPSLQELAANAWPRFEQIDGEKRRSVAGKN
ncbi:MAG TPA: lytic transglycosylase domain-containing protein [Geminicoccaceae bacterium]|nr:lytic transglycosylase domain-containing protein [Geminicoccaceae bacterium]